MAVEDLEKWVAINKFPELERSAREQLWETLLPHVEPYLKDENYAPAILAGRQLQTLRDFSDKEFFIAGDKLYKRNTEGKH